MKFRSSKKAMNVAHGDAIELLFRPSDCHIDFVLRIGLKRLFHLFLNPANETSSILPSFEQNYGVSPIEVLLARLFQFNLWIDEKIPEYAVYFFGDSCLWTTPADSHHIVVTYRPGGTSGA
ncbi:MAG: hypothetical protein ACXVCB_03420 [Bdellovibrionota bacterium]